MRKSRLVPLAAGALIAGIGACFEQTESFDLPSSPTTLQLDLGEFDPACNSVRGNTTYQSTEGGACHVTYDKPSITVSDMNALRQIIVNNGVDLSQVDVSFHGQMADDMDLVVDSAQIPLAASVPVTSWNASLSVQGTSVGMVSKTSVAVNNLLPAPVSFTLPGPVIDALDTAWNQMATVDAHIHAELIIDAQYVPSMVAGGDLKLNLTVELAGSGTTTTHGWP